MRARVLVFGGTGLLGRAVARSWSEAELMLAGSAEADIRDARQVRRMVAERTPDLVLLAAAYTDVDGCELNPKLAHAVNCQGAVNVMEACREAGARLVFISTDYVFDGEKGSPYEESDPVEPLNHYGRSKAQAERRLLGEGRDVLIVRTSWLFGEDRNCFPARIIERLQKCEAVKVVEDQRGRPTYAPDLADALWALVRRGTTGLMHVANEGVCSWLEFAQEIARQTSAENRLEPISSAELRRAAKRPRYSALSLQKLTASGTAMRPWQAALEQWLHLNRELANPVQQAAVERI